MEGKVIQTGRSCSVHGNRSIALENALHRGAPQQSWNFDETLIHSRAFNALSKAFVVGAHALGGSRGAVDSQHMTSTLEININSRRDSSSFDLKLGNFQRSRGLPPSPPPT